MTDKEILEQQVDALEKLLQIKDAIIYEQERRIEKLEGKDSQFAPFTSPHFYGSGSITYTNACHDGLPHEYDSVWLSTGPQSCKKCGSLAAPSISTTLTCDTNTAQAGTIKVDNARHTIP